MHLKLNNHSRARTDAQSDESTSRAAVAAKKDLGYEQDLSMPFNKMYIIGDCSRGHEIHFFTSVSYI